MWKGDRVGYAALHAWVRRHLIMPSKCELCKRSAKLDLANISQQYKRDLKDWEWLCRKCHMNKDGRIKNLKVGNGPKTFCKCGKIAVGKGVCMQQYDYLRRVRYLPCPGYKDMKRWPTISNSRGGGGWCSGRLIEGVRANLIN